MNRCGLMATVLCVVAFSAPADSEVFEDAAVLPGDVTSYIHIADPEAWRASTAGAFVHRFGRATIFGDGDRFDRVWNRLALRAGVTSTALFDICFGDGFTMAICDRDLHDGAVGREWVVIGRGDDAGLRTVLGRLRPQTQLPRFGFAVMLEPESDLLLAHRDGVLIAGPHSQRRLFTTVLERHDRQHGGGLLRDDVMQWFRTNDHDGDINVWVRSDAQNPGAIGVVARIDDANLRATVRGAFEASPFMRTRTGRAWDASMVGLFERDALIVMMEPTDIDGGPMPMLLRRGVGPGGWPGFEDVPERGDTRVFIVGEAEGRQRDEPIDLRLPTLTMIVPTHGAITANHQVLDDEMIRIARKLESLDDQAPIDGMGPTADIDEPRCANLKRLLAPIAEDMPLAAGISLNWQTIEIDGGQCAWVMSSHPVGLATASKALEASKNDVSPDEGRWDSVGAVNGRRLSAHIRSYIARPDLLADERDAEAFREVLGLGADVLELVDIGHWRLTRPDSTSFDMTVNVQFVNRASRSEPK